MNQQIILSPVSMSVINTPLIEYFRSRLIKEFGEAEAEQIIAAEYRYMSRMDEPKSSNQTQMEMATEKLLYPILGLYEGMQELGYPHAYSLEVLKRILDEAPEEVKRIQAQQNNDYDD